MSGPLPDIRPPADFSDGRRPPDAFRPTYLTHPPPGPFTRLPRSPGTEPEQARGTPSTIATAVGAAVNRALSEDAETPWNIGSFHAGGGRFGAFSPLAIGVPQARDTRRPVPGGEGLLTALFSTRGVRRAHHPDPSPALGHMPQAQPGTRFARALPFRTENVFRDAGEGGGIHAPRDSRRRGAGPSAGSRSPRPTALPQRRARPHRPPAPPPHRCCRPGPRRPTPSR